MPQFLRKPPLLCREPKTTDLWTQTMTVLTLPTEVRRRVQRALRTRSFRQALRSSTGAIDLASIMVGVIVIGVIAGVIAATVFAVVPWAQQAAARQDLDAVRTAESVAYVQEGRFLTTGSLVANGYLQAPRGYVATAPIGGSGFGLHAAAVAPTLKVAIATDAAGTCFVALAQSDSGVTLLSTNSGPGVDPVTSATAVSCIDEPSFSSLLASVGSSVKRAPDAPTSVAAVAADGAANVSWTAIGQGSPKYSVVPYLGSVAQQATSVVGTPAPTQAVIGGLVNGSVYTFRVSASDGAASSDLSAPSNSVTPVGLLVNGNFESGSTGWYFSTGSLNTSPGRTGVAERLGQTGVVAQMTQSVKVPATGTTTLSFWYRVEIPNGGTAAAYAGGQVIPMYNYSNQPGTLYWTNATKDLTPFAGTTIQIRFDLDARNASVYASNTIDDVTVTNR